MPVRWTRKLAERKARAKGRHTEAEWEVVVRLSQNMCLQCLRSGNRTRLTKDHIVPITAGGSDDIMNLQPLCIPCNVQKGRQIQDLRGSYLRDLIRAETVDVPLAVRKPYAVPLTWTLADKMQAAMGGA